MKPHVTPDRYLPVDCFTVPVAGRTEKQLNGEFSHALIVASPAISDLAGNLKIEVHFRQTSAAPPYALTGDILRLAFAVQAVGDGKSEYPAYAAVSNRVVSVPNLAGARYVDGYDKPYIQTWLHPDGLGGLYYNQQNYFDFRANPGFSGNRLLTYQLHADNGAFTDSLWDMPEFDIIRRGMELTLPVTQDTQIDSTYEINFNTIQPLIDPHYDDTHGSLLPAIASGDTSALAMSENRVFGMAADGATLLVWRVPALFVGQNVHFQNQYSSSTTGLGATLERIPYDPGHPEYLNSLDAPAVSTPRGPMAFALIRAPTLEQSGLLSDREYSIYWPYFKAITSSPDMVDGYGETVLPTMLFRPPVVLIHGLHAFPGAFDDLKARLEEPFSGSEEYWRGPEWAKRFVRTLNYSEQITVPFAKYPDGEIVAHARIREHSLGLDYNAPLLLNAIQSEILPEFRRKYSVAAVKVDVIGHSMGGLMARRMMLESNYSSWSENYKEGTFNRLITVGTPHLGSHMATRLMSGNNNCIVGKQRDSNWDPLSWVMSWDDETYNGATNDLQGGETSGVFSPSQALQSLADHSTSHPGNHGLSASFVEGIAGEGQYGTIFDIQGDLARYACGSMWFSPSLGLGFGPTERPDAIILRQGDALADWYSSSRWMKVSNGLPTDGIVSSISARDGLVAPDSAVSIVSACHGPGTIHGPLFSLYPNFSIAWMSTSHLGLNGPHLLQKDSSSLERIMELVSPPTNANFFKYYP